MVLRSHIKFHPQQTPYTSVAGSRHLLEDANIYPGTATFSPEQLALLASICEMGKQSIFALNVLLLHVEDTCDMFNGRCRKLANYKENWNFHSIV